jgi:hypothetical protein
VQAAESPQLMRGPLGCSSEFSVVRTLIVISLCVYVLGCGPSSPGERAAWATARAYVIAVQQVDSASLARLGRSGDARQALCAARHWPVEVTGRNGTVPDVHLVRQRGGDSVWVFVALGSPTSSPDSLREGYGLEIGRQDPSRVLHMYRIRESAADTALAICLHAARAA